MTNPAVVLASSSPQRRDLLNLLGVAFETVPAGVEEEEAGPPLDVAQENAYRKAAHVARARPDGLVLGVDTVVALGTRIYGKPRDEFHARASLEALSGRTHLVISGVCVIRPGDPPRVAAAQTSVTFRTLDPPLLDWYLAAGEWRERAGGYALQGRGGALVTRIDGDFTNVVGLPLPTLIDLVPEFAAPPA